MANTAYKSTGNVSKKFQSLKGKTNSKFHQNFSDYYDDNNYHRQNASSPNFEKILFVVMLVV